MEITEDEGGEGKVEVRNKGAIRRHANMDK